MMSDDEDYSSGSDEDYVPSDKEGLSEEDESGEDEDLALLKEAGDPDTASVSTKKANVTKRKRKETSNLLPRKRKGGIKLEGADSAADSAEKQENLEEHMKLEQEIKQEEETKKVEKEKKKADNLWASFLSDVSSKPKPAPRPATSIGLGALSTVSKSSTSTANGDGKTPVSSTSSSKITVTKVFDFAGEEVKLTMRSSEKSADDHVDDNHCCLTESQKRVTEEVDTKSKEGQKVLKQIQEEKTSRNTTDPSTASLAPTVPVVKSLPKSGGLGSVLGKIGKMNTISTLNKSKLDWESFKKDEGINEDLQIHNRGKEGYTERMAFLERADIRQFEIEKSHRQSSSKR